MRLLAGSVLPNAELPNSFAPSVGRAQRSQVRIWERMQRVREEWEQCATPSKLIEWAEAREKDGARLRELAASRSREVGR